MDKYRIDNQFRTVYIYHSDLKAYIFFASFFEIGITQDMNESEQLEKIEAWEDEDGH